MTRWSYERKKNNSSPHSFLSILAILGLGVIVVGFASTVFSNTPTPVGHDPSQIGSGTFSGIASDVWNFPGNARIATKLVVGSLTPPGVAQAVEVIGQIHASGDICTDAAGGKCLSQMSGAILSTGWQTVCTPGVCEGNTPSGGPSTNLETYTQPITASCPAGFKIVSCGGGVRVYGSGASSRGNVINIVSNGCDLVYWTAGAVTSVGGYVKAFCAPIV